MPSRDVAFLRHQRARWLRPDAHRWVRADAARFLKRDTDLGNAFPALGQKYNASQPRVPAGNSDGGQWTGGNSNGASQPQPMGNIDFGDLPNFGDLFALFQIAPSDVDFGDLIQLAGDPPAGDGPGMGHNQGPPLEPPEIPEMRPSTSDARMDIVWKVTGLE